MNITKTLVATLSMVGGLSNVVAATSSPDLIVSVAAFGSGNVGVAMSNGTPLNPAGCTFTVSHKWYKMIDTTDHGKNMYAMLLAAKSSAAKVTLLIDDAVCGGGYAIINAVILN